MTSTAMITGASKGIGRETALLFADKGYDLVLAARNAEELQVVVSEVQAKGRRAIAIPTDVKDVAQVEHLVQQAIEAMGSIDVLINNAGIYMLGPTEACSLDDWHHILDTNLWGYIHTIYALLPHFLERRAGTIVNVSSIAGLVPLPYQVPYTTSKFAITGLTKSLRNELEPKGIQVCGIYPNFIQSDLMERIVIRGNDEDSVRDRYKLMEQSMKVPGFEKPDDVAKAIWKAVKHRKDDTVVGLANVSEFLYRLFPGAMQAIVRKAFGLKEAA